MGMKPPRCVVDQGSSGAASGRPKLQDGYNNRGQNENELLRLTKNRDPALKTRLFDKINTPVL